MDQCFIISFWYLQDPLSEFSTVSDIFNKRERISKMLVVILSPIGAVRVRAETSCPG
jgi:hypothetical protein